MLGEDYVHSLADVGSGDSHGDRCNDIQEGETGIEATTNGNERGTRGMKHITQTTLISVQRQR